MCGDGRELVDGAYAEGVSKRPPRYLFGAQAALLYGSARLTADVDATVLLGEASTEELVAALKAEG